MIEIEKNLIGKEDILFGVGTVTQQRGGKSVSITKINTAEMPYDETLTLAEKLQEVVEGNIIDDSDIALDKTYSSAKIQQIDDDQQIQIDANQQNIANLATAQAEFGSSTPLVLTTSEQTLDWDTLVPSTDTDVMTLDDVTNNQLLKLNASFNYKTDMEFAIGTNQARLITVRGRKLSDDSLIYERSVTVDSNNGSTETIHTNKLLTVGKNGIPSQPLDIYFTIQCNGTGITLNNWSSNLASSASYDLTTTSKFTELLDTPNSYQGQAGKYPRVNNTEDGLDFGSSLSTIACSICTGTVAIDNIIPTKGSLTYLYIGTGVSNPLDLGVGFIDFTVAFNGSGYWLDRSGGYGNEVFRNDAGIAQDLTTPIVLALPVNKYAGKFDIKNRDATDSHQNTDSLIGIDSYLHTNTNGAEETNVNRITDVSTTGITIGTDVTVNTLNEKYVLHIEVYTHIIASLVNGNLQVVAWNPITKMGMAYRLGSDSIVNADRPFKVDYQETKRLDSTTIGPIYYGDNSKYLQLHSVYSTYGALDIVDFWDSTSPTSTAFTFIGGNTIVNQLGGVYVDYFFGNSEYKKLTDNGSKITIEEFDINRNTSLLTDKNYSTTGDWNRIDYQRGNTKVIELNTVDIEKTITADNRVNGTEDIIFPFVTDDNNLLVTDGGYIYTDGKNLDGSFNKTSEAVSGVQSFDLTGVSDGKKYLAREYGTGALKAYDGYSVGLYDKESADDNRLVFDVESGKHYETVGGELVVNGTFDTDVSGWSTNNSSITQASGGLQVTATTVNGYAVQGIATIIGETYCYIARLKGTTSGQCQLFIGTEGGDYSNVLEFTATNTAETKDVSGVFTATTTTTFISLVTTAVGYTTNFDNVSVFKKEATLDTPLATPVSFISRYPYMVVSETPQYEMVNEKAIPVNMMDNLTASGDIETKGKFVGKNACTAWVSFDGTTTPPTIRSSFNVIDVVRIATGRFEIYFTEDMSTNKYVGAYAAINNNTNTGDHLYQCVLNYKTPQKVAVNTGFSHTSGLLNLKEVEVIIFGGKN